MSVRIHGHHILPKSIFPKYKNFKDNSWNRINLSIREHIIAHRILAKAGNNSMVRAFFMMSKLHKNKGYNVSDLDSTFTFSIESKKKMSISAIKRWQNMSTEESERYSIINSIKSSGENNGRYDPTIYTFKHRETNDVFIGTQYKFSKYSNLTAQEIYNIIHGGLRHSKNWGVYLKQLGIFSYEKEFKMPKNHPSKRTKQCYYCGKICSIGNFSRWHGDNCKKKPDDLLILE